jgi:hypothetical protein
MKPTVTFVVALLLAAGAKAGDVYVTKDAKGNPVYTDTPVSIPAQKVNVNSKSTDPAALQKRYSDEMNRYAEEDSAASKAIATTKSTESAASMTAEDRAKRCVDARQRYQGQMDARRLYEDDANGGRRYLTSQEIDAARANAKQVMDEFCAGQ